MSGPPSPRALGPTAPAQAQQASVVAADPSQPFHPRPVLAELLRTRHCVLGSVLLVEAIDAHVPVSRTYRAVRLLLGDGDLCVQALLRAEMHRFVDHGSIHVGAYVQLHKFELRGVLPTRGRRRRQRRPAQEGGGGVEDDDDDEEGVAADQAAAAGEEMVFLVVWDMVTVGWDTAYMQMAGVTPPARRRQQQQPDPHARRPEVKAREAGADQPTGQKNEGVVVAVAPSRQRAATQPAPNKKLLGQRSEADPPKEARATIHYTKEALPAQQQRQQQQQQQQQQQHHQKQQSTTTTTTTTPLPPWASHDLSHPLKLTPLKSIPNLPYKQNWVVNVLAVVSSLSPLTPATLPPFTQRTARLADPSTGKHVLLTVFLDPEGFAPGVGSVVLLLGVKNHRFDGGSLKKYGNERGPSRVEAEGGKGKEARWWFENPGDIAWCDVEGLRRWWVEKGLEAGGG